jgi:hypothetical protein
MLKDKTFWYGAIAGAALVFFLHPRTRGAMRGGSAQQQG